MHSFSYKMMKLTMNELRRLQWTLAFRKFPVENVCSNGSRPIYDSKQTNKMINSHLQFVSIVHCQFNNPETDSPFFEKEFSTFLVSSHGCIWYRLSRFVTFLVCDFGHTVTLFIFNIVVRNLY